MRAMPVCARTSETPGMYSSLGTDLSGLVSEIVRIAALLVTPSMVNGYRITDV